jgi:fructokinase
MPLPWAEPGEFPGPPCYCGRSGCLETWISGSGLERDFFHVTGKSLRGKEIVTASEAGDPDAQAALERLVSRMGRGLAAMIDIVDPDVIVLGGGLSNIDWLYPRVTSEISRYTFGGAVETPVLKAMHGDSSGVRGAAWLWAPHHEPA